PRCRLLQTSSNRPPRQVRAQTARRASAGHYYTAWRKWGMIQTVTADNTTTFHEIVEQARGLVPNERDEFVRRVCGHDETLLSLVLIALGDRQGEQALSFKEDDRETA